jgi:REP element-mobilizing transposase RayT
MRRTFRPIIERADYFITCTTHHRKTWFSNPNLAQIVVEQWRHYEQTYELVIHTYAVHPDHYHIVVNVGEKKTISEIIHAVNSYSSTKINEALGKERKVKIWGGRPWDEVIRNEEMFWQKVAYTLFNPWRAGYVENPLSLYPFSNIDEWIEREGDEFLWDLFSRYKRWYE